MIFYVLLDGSGNAKSFLSYGAVPSAQDIPVGAVEVSDADYATWIASPGAHVWRNGALLSLAPVPAAPRYVTLSLIRDRVTALGKWVAFAAALDGLSPDKRWHLLTLADGVASDDPDAVALLTQVGADPVAVLAP